MLDVLESLGLDFDGIDSGQSMRLHSRMFPSATPQSVCSRLVELEAWLIVGAIGFWHCARSWERYHA